MGVVHGEDVDSVWPSIAAPASLGPPPGLDWSIRPSRLALIAASPRSDASRTDPRLRGLVLQRRPGHGVSAAVSHRVRVDEIVPVDEHP